MDLSDEGSSMDDDDPQVTFLNIGTPVGNQITDGPMMTAPIITGDVYDALDAETVPQVAVLGRVISQHSAGFPRKTQGPKLLVNTNSPFSAVICGLQVSSFACVNDPEMHEYSSYYRDQESRIRPLFSWKGA